MSIRGAVLTATAAAGTLDITAAIVSWTARGATPMSVLQGVAGGVLGRATFDGGVASAALGLLLHFSIMAVIALLFVRASRHWPLLTRHWIACGVAYGIGVYLVMTYIVVPLSAAAGRLPSLAAFAQGLVIHIVCVGLTIAYLTRRFDGARHY